MAVGARMRDPDRHPRGLGEDRALRPFFALSVGFARSSSHPAVPWSSPRRPPANPTRSPPARRIRAGPDARSRGIRRPPAILEAAVRRRRAGRPGQVERVPLHPRPEHQRDRVRRVAVRHARVVAAQRVRRPFRQQRLDPLTTSPAYASPRPSRRAPSSISLDRNRRWPSEFDGGYITPSGIGPKWINVGSDGAAIGYRGLDQR